jgi:hypothetical protein
LARREVSPEKRVAIEWRFEGSVLYVAGERAQRGAEDLRVDLLFG